MMHAATAAMTIAAKILALPNLGLRCFGPALRVCDCIQLPYPFFSYSVQTGTWPTSTQKAPFYREHGIENIPEKKNSYLRISMQTLK
jgi:hypothetical protein